MSHSNSALYSPYGSYELKAKYQRNFLMATSSAVAMVLFILAVSWVIKALSEEEVLAGAPILIQTVADLGPPPTIAKKPPQIQVDVPQAAMPKVGIPTPVADDEVLDEDVVIASREDLAQIVAPDMDDLTSDDNIVVDIADDDLLPTRGVFKAVEIYPEMIRQEKPEYPRLARQAGLEGVVVIEALVLRDGSVKDAVVGKSSGTAALDEAAVKAAYKNRFKPAIQNGRPVACWVSYKMVFELPK